MTKQGSFAADVCTCTGTAKVEPHIVAVSCIEHIIVLDARVAARDAAGAVCSSCTCLLHRNASVAVAGNAVGLLAAVGCLKRSSIIAVSIGGSRGCIVSRVAEGVAVVAPCGYADSCRVEEAVGKCNIVIIVRVGICTMCIFPPADEPAPAVCICTQQLARESTTIKVNISFVGVEVAYEPAVSAITFNRAVDADTADTVLDVIVAASSCDCKAAVVLCRAVDAAINDEVLDGDIVEAIEWCTRLVAILL